MKIKTFQGRSIEELLPQIRAELGPDAVIIGQRTKVEGGVAGFFGTKVIEVTAADRMPSDDQLVELEDQIMTPPAASAASAAKDPEEVALAARFTAAMAGAGAAPPRPTTSINVTDDWDPSSDAELAQEYGRVLEHATTSGFTELDVPIIEEPLDPRMQAQLLANRTHRRVQDSTSRVEQATSFESATYGPPAALPREPGYEPRSTTFGASVQDTDMRGFEPAAITDRSAAAATVTEALHSDLGLTTHAPIPVQRRAEQITSALDAAVDMVDLKAMAALRNAMHVSRTLGDATSTTVVDPAIELEVTTLSAQLDVIGVDADVIEALMDVAVRHRLPFSAERDVATTVRSLIEETIDIRTGFPRLGRAYRVAMVGASSSGKTTVLAKLAHGYRATGLSVGIIAILSADPASASIGDDRFRSLDADVRYVATIDQALHAIEAFADHDLVLVDTPGSSYLDPATFSQVRGCFSAIGIDDVSVVLPLATSSREARSLVDTFRPIGANRLIVSRIDESRYIGQLLNFGFRLGLPMTFLSDGPRADTGCHAASARDIAARILPSDSHAA